MWFELGWGILRAEISNAISPCKIKKTKGNLRFSKFFSEGGLCGLSHTPPCGCGNRNKTIAVAVAVEVQTATNFQFFC